MASTWGTNTWGANTWQSDEIVVSITSPGTISALGTPQSFNVEGWGRQQWNNSGWGVEYSVEPSGVSITSSQGTAEGAPTTIAELTGISSNVNATFPTVDLETPVTLSGFGITSSLGSVVSANEEGWGRAEWGNGAWGVQYSVEPSGLEITSSVGSLTTANVVDINGLEITSSVGEILPADVMGITGQSITSAIGDLSNSGTLVGWGRNGWGEEPWDASVNSLVQITGVQAEASVGSITPADVIGLTGVSATGNVGSITPADVMGLTGVESTLDVGTLSIFEELL